MSIYSKNYRKIYEQIFGPIPKDEYGRTYDIHHIDGNRNNNSPENLIALSIEEHYNIHYNQGDWGACHVLSSRMNLTPEEISILGSKAQKKRVEAQTHNFLGSNNNKKRIEDGTHNFLTNNPTHQKIQNGTHIFLDENFQKMVTEKSKIRNKKMVEEGTHLFVTNNPGGESSRNRIKEGTHHFLTNNPGKVSWFCEKCGVSGKGKSNFTRYHANNKCKI